MKLTKISAGLVLWSIMTACSAGLVSAQELSHEMTAGSKYELQQEVPATESVLDGTDESIVENHTVSDSSLTDESIGENLTASDETFTDKSPAGKPEASKETLDENLAASGESLAEESLAEESLPDGALPDESLADTSLTEEPAPSETPVGVTIRRDIEDGLYVLIPRLNSARCVSIAGNSKSAGANVQLVARNGGFAQAFYVRRLQGTSRYTFVNYHSGLAMEMDSKFNVIQNPLTNELNQQWVLEDLGNGYLQIRACGKTKVLDLPAGATGAGTNIWTYTANQSNAQMWQLVRAGGKVAAEARLEDANLRKGYYRITPSNLSGLSVDITSNSKNNKANIRLYTKMNTGAQIFRIVPLGDGTYTINGYNSGKYFDCVNARAGSNIYQATSRNSGYQRWYILKDASTGKIVIRGKYGSHVVMCAEGEGKGANVGQASFAGTSGQYWTLTKIYGSNIHVEPKDGIYEFRSGLNENMCLDVASGSSLNNANIQLYSANGSDAQRFAIVGSGYGVYKVINVNSMRALHLVGNKNVNGTNVVQYRSFTSQAQNWRILWNSRTGGYLVKPYGKSVQLAVAGESAVNGANVQANTTANTAGQMWVLKRISSYDGTHHMKVMCSGTTCTFKVYQILNGVFTEKLSTSGYIGRNGSGKTREGDGKTPIGTFTVGKAYGIADDPGSIIPYTKVTNDMYWCARSDSPYYNTLINAAKAGAGDEHLIEYTDSYRYLLDIGYNKECTPGLGSAIFLHCSRNQTTAGCIAIPTEDMVRTLQMIGVGTKISIE